MITFDMRTVSGGRLIPLISGSQHRVLAALVAFVAENKRSPSHRELARAVGVSYVAIAKHLIVLQEKGLVDFVAGAPRSLVVTLRGKKAAKREPVSTIEARRKREKKGG